MARVRAYGRLTNEHRDVSLGGRRQNRRVTAWLNTDNATHSDCGATLVASVHPASQAGDTSFFEVALPFQHDANCKAFVRVEDAPRLRLHGLVSRKSKYEDVLHMLPGLDKYVMPGGYPLDHMLACVALCEALGLTPESPRIECKEDLDVVVNTRRRGLVRV